MNNVLNESHNRGEQILERILTHTERVISDSDNYVVIRAGSLSPSVDSNELFLCFL